MAALEILWRDFQEGRAPGNLRESRVQELPFDIRDMAWCQEICLCRLADPTVPLCSWGCDKGPGMGLGRMQVNGPFDPYTMEFTVPRTPEWKPVLAHIHWRLIDHRDLWPLVAGRRRMLFAGTAHLQHCKFKKCLLIFFFCFKSFAF